MALVLFWQLLFWLQRLLCMQATKYLPIRPNRQMPRPMPLNKLLLSPPLWWNLSLFPRWSQSLPLW